MTEVRLSFAECSAAAGLAVNRHLYAIFKDMPDNHGVNGDGWEAHIEGACGELAAAKAIDCYPLFTLNNFKQPDLPHNTHVRLRLPANHSMDLIVRPDDADDGKYILVTGQMPAYQVWGWIYGRDAKRPEWLKDHGGRPDAWFVPKSALKPFTEFPRT